MNGVSQAGARMRLRDGVEVRESDSGAFVLDAKRGVYWHLNRTALLLIQHIDDDDPVGCATEAVCLETGEAPEVVGADFAVLVEQLCSANLIEEEDL